MTQDFQGPVSKFIEEKIRFTVGDDRPIVVPASLLAKFIASTFLIVLRWWFDEDMRHTPEQMDEMFRRLVMPAMHQILEVQDK